jgi:S-formylglutathione hydrolase FrmB
MAFCQLHWSSKVLGKQTTTWLLLPEDLPGPFPTFYLLHGHSDDHTMWLRRTRIEPYVAGKPLIVVMPDGGRGWYTNNENGPAWAEHIGVELPGFIEKNFPAIASREGRFVGGLSMGGYGALRLALGYPERFISANSHSGSVLFGTKPQTDPMRQLAVGKNPAGTDHDLLVLAQRARATLPRLRIDCGVDDFLIEDNRALHQKFGEMRIPHEYQEFPGAHTWDYWDLHVQEAMEFHLRSS